ncbi:glycosyltransferase family 2 protein [Rhizobium sp. CAU 1783]
MTVSTPDVSIIIAAFNAAGTIERAIASALDQEDVSLEVIVIDDCSTDGTRAVVAGFEDPRLRFVPLRENLGPGGARNAGIDIAEGRWIAILDADDTMRPDRLARMIDKAEAGSAEIAVDNLAVVTGDGNSRAMFDELDLATLPFLTLADFIGSNVLFRDEYNFGYMKPVFLKRFLNDHGLRFDESLRIGEDYMLLASALAVGGECIVCPGVGYLYSVTEGSISRVLEVHHVEAMLAADAAFLRRYRLDRKAFAAQNLRHRSLRQARSFLTLVGQLKRRSYTGALCTAISDPAALRHLRMPIAVRLRRLITAKGRPSETPAKRHNPANGPHASKG